jgi:hypothetical protein
MKKLWPWLLGIGLLVILSIVLLVGAGFVRYAHSPVTMMGDRLRSSNDYDGYWMRRDALPGTSLAFPVVGILGGLLMCAVPIGVVALIVIGIIMLVRAAQRPAQGPPVVPAPVCPNCGKSVQSDWKVCPHCGESLEN